MLEDDVGRFLISRTECRAHDLVVYLEFGGTADREDFQLTVEGVVVTDRITLPTGVASVELTLTELHDDMTAAPRG